MIAIVLAMLAVLVVSSLVVAYVAYPHRGEEMPRTPWLGDVLRRGVDTLPTIDTEKRHERTGR